MVLSIIFLIIGLVGLVWGAELLIRGASRIAYHFGISPLVIGLTIVAFGTSAPEAAISIYSSILNQSDIAVGNVVGSNIFNILIVLGISAAVKPLIVSNQIIRLEVPIMLVCSFVFLLFCYDGLIGFIDGLILFSGIIIYAWWSIQRSRKQTFAAQEMVDVPIDDDAETYSNKQIALEGIKAFAGIIVLVAGSQFMVRGAVDIARILGVSELIIGLTIVSVGTSLPEVATSVISTIKGKADIAIGNAVGSNIYNLLFVLGISGIVVPGGVPVAGEALQFDIPVMLAVSIACLPIFFTGNILARWEGFFFLFYYVVYIVHLILLSTTSPELRLFHQAAVYFLLPLTFITLAVSFIRYVKVKYLKQL